MFRLVREGWCWGGGRGLAAGVWGGSSGMVAWRCLHRGHVARQVCMQWVQYGECAGCVGCLHRVGTCHALGLSIEESQTPAGRGGWVGVDLDPDECCRVRVMRGPQMLHLWLWPRSHRPSHCPALLFGIIGVPILYSHTAAVEGWMNE